MCVPLECYLDTIEPTSSSSITVQVSTLFTLADTQSSTESLTALPMESHFIGGVQELRSGIHRNGGKTHHKRCRDPLQRWQHQQQGTFWIRVRRHSARDCPIFTQLTTTVDHDEFTSETTSAFPWWYILIFIIILILFYVLILVALMKLGFLKRRRYFLDSSFHMYFREVRRVRPHSLSYKRLFAIFVLCRFLGVCVTLREALVAREDSRVHHLFSLSMALLEPRAYQSLIFFSMLKIWICRQPSTYSMGPIYLERKLGGGGANDQR